MQTYVWEKNVQVNHRLHDAGTLIDLDDESAAPLLDSGLIRLASGADATPEPIGIEGPDDLARRLAHLTDPQVDELAHLTAEQIDWRLGTGPAPEGHDDVERFLDALVDMLEDTEPRIARQFCARVVETVHGALPGPELLEVLGVVVPQPAGDTAEAGADPETGGETAGPDGGAAHRTELIKAGINSLDPDNPKHYTKSGLPRVPAVEAACGLDDVTRDEIDALTGDAT